MLELHLKRYVAQTEMSVPLVSQEDSRLLHSQILYQYNGPKPIIDEMGAIIKNGAMVTHISMPACMATNHQTRHSYSCAELQFVDILNQSLCSLIIDHYVPCCYHLKWNPT